MTTIGSLFTGYGGLDMGVTMALDPSARVAWTSDIEPGPCKLATTRWPDTPNLGDITKINWTDVEPVDVICGGSPCQDLSLAGKRTGMTSGTRSGLWSYMAAAVKILQPRLVVWENVQGALSARAYSPVEQEPWMLGNQATQPALRAAGRVCGDLAGLGYDCRWAVIRASDTGAPHQRARLFLVGHPHGQPWDMRRPATPGETPGRRPQRQPTEPNLGPLIPTPTASDHKADRHPEGTGNSLTQAVHLLPTPQVTDATATSTGYGANLHEVARELLPTPSASDSIMGPPQTSGHQSAKATKLATHIEYTDFGKYAPAIARWEQVLGRMAPAPTIPSRREGGRARLSTRFVEWMMGLPDGYITDLNLPRAHQLLLLGNGVVPQQAALAVRTLIHTAKEAENARF